MKDKFFTVKEEKLSKLKGNARFAPAVTNYAEIN